MTSFYLALACAASLLGGDPAPAAKSDPVKFAPACCQPTRAADETGPRNPRAPRPDTISSSRRVLRIGADPNNLPFTNERGEGFENRLAALFARELNADIEYVWRAQRKNFFKKVFEDHKCDLVLGVPAGFSGALTTAPYYRAGYVFVARNDGRPAVRSLDDPRLRELTIAAQFVGDGGANTPPMHALAARGLADRVAATMIYADHSRPDPLAIPIVSVAEKRADLAIAWGPIAGYYASRQQVELQLTPIPQREAPAGLTFEFDITCAVNKAAPRLRDELNEIIQSKRAEIDRILAEYRIPRVGAKAP